MLELNYNNCEQLVNDETAIKKIVDSLKKGGVVAIPTDTVYGLSCLVNKPAAIARIRELKGRADDKPLLLLAASYDNLEGIAVVTAEQKNWLKENIFSPTTVILEAVKSIEQITSVEKTVAVRVPKNDFLLKLIKDTNSLLVSTSLNRAGETVLIEPINLVDYFGLDLIEIAVNIGPLVNESSAIYDVRDLTAVKKIR